MASAARRGRPFWEKLVEDYEASGRAHVAFALERGVSVGTFRHWLYKLRTERPAHGSSRSAPRLLPVTVAGSASSELLEVGMDGFVIRFRAGTDTSYVASLVAALRERA